MTQFLTSAIPLALLVLACWLVARASISLRILSLVVVASCFAYVGFSFGISFQKTRFYSSYIYWFRAYSAHLKQRVESKDYELLSHDILLFDRRFSTAPENANNLEDTMYEIQHLGPYYQPSK